MADIFNEATINENEVLVDFDVKPLSYEEQMLEKAKQALEQCKKGELKMYTQEEFFKKLDDFLNV